jgi:hypothetical protein
MAVAAAERGRNTGHSRGILRVQDAKNEGEGMATNSQLQFSHFPKLGVVRTRSFQSVEPIEAILSIL